MHTHAQVKADPKAAPGLTPVRGSLLQRKCACGGSAALTGECEECRKKKLEGSSRTSALVQRRADGYVVHEMHHEAEPVPPILHEVLRSPGQPLDAATRAFFEPRFGHDFSRVRIHTDARAAESARAVDALAYTVGRDVVFGRGRFVPESSEGRQLLAHELVHTLQDDSAKRSSGHLLVGPVNTQSELEADRISEAVVARRQPMASSLMPVSAGARSLGLPQGFLLQRVCSEHPDQDFYESADNYCQDTPGTSQLHPGQTCFREVPGRTSYWDCPPGDQVCFDSEGGCHDSWDEASPVESKDEDGTCNLHFICSLAHAYKDKVVQTWVDKEMEREGRRQLDCAEICEKQPWYLRGFCHTGCSGGPMF